MEITPTNKWVYGQDDEYFDCADEFESKYEAVLAGNEDYVDEDFYIGDLSTVKFDKSDIELMSLSERIVDDLCEILYDNVGELADLWETNITYDMQKELDSKLSAVIMDWIENTVGQPTVCQVNNIEKIEKNIE